MSDDDSQRAFADRCARIARVATDSGITLRKVDGRHELDVSRGSDHVVFPIVTDEADWRKTTPQEALYGVLLDAQGWRGAKPDDVPSAAAETKAPLFNAVERGRPGGLGAVLGGFGVFINAAERAEQATFAQIESAEQAEPALIKRDAAAETDHLQRLAALLGGDAALENLIAMAAAPDATATS